MVYHEADNYIGNVSDIMMIKITVRLKTKRLKLKRIHFYAQIKSVEDVLRSVQKSPSFRG